MILAWASPFKLLNMLKDKNKSYCFKKYHMLVEILNS